MTARKTDGMIRAPVTGGGPLGYASHFCVYPPYDDEVIPAPDYSGLYRRQGEHPDYTYHWEPA